MPVRIQAPDGSIAEFPDGMPDDQIAAVMRQEYGGPDPRAPSQALGFWRGASRVLDNAAMALESGASAVGVPTDRVNNFFALPSSAEVATRRDNAFATASRKPGAIGEFAGSIAGTVPVAAAVGATGPIGGGAAFGALNTKKRDFGGIASDAAWGAAGGKVGDKVVKTAGAVIAPKLAPAVQKLTDAGVKLTPGQLFQGGAKWVEDRASSLPVVGRSIEQGRERSLETYNRAWAQRSLDHLGIKLPKDVPAGHDAIDFAHRTISEAYDAVLPQIQMKVDQRFVAGLRNIGSAIQALPEANQKQIQAVLGQIKFGQGSTLTGQALKTAESELSRLQRSYGSSGVASEREMAQVFGGLRTQLREMAIRQNPQAGAELQRINKAFADLATAEDAASRGVGGLATPAQHSQAVRRSDPSRRKNASARGKARGQDFADAGRTVLPSKVGNSGTADRMNVFNPMAYVGLPAWAGYKAGQAAANIFAAPRPASAPLIRQQVERLRRPAALIGAGAMQKDAN